MATGLLRPDAGTIEVLGTDVWRDTVKAKSLVGDLAVERLPQPDDLEGRRARGAAAAVMRFTLGRPLRPALPSRG
ncbi:MAG: drrA4 [Naasia sp.]|nr:drrA4 [Naasia sp.]